jgi:hypothetical protein
MTTHLLDRRYGLARLSLRTFEPAIAPCLSAGDDSIARSNRDQLRLFQALNPNCNLTSRTDISWRSQCSEFGLACKPSSSRSHSEDME